MKSGLFVLWMEVYTCILLLGVRVSITEESHRGTLNDSQLLNATKLFSDYEVSLLNVDIYGRMGANSGQILVNFTAYGEQFILHLWSYLPFDDGTPIYVDNDLYKCDFISQQVGLFKGRVIRPYAGEVLLRIADGVEGIIRTEKDTLYVEPLTKFDTDEKIESFKTKHTHSCQDNSTFVFCIVVYKGSDILHNARTGFNNNRTSYCPSRWNDTILTFPNTFSRREDKRESGRERRSLNNNECSLHVVADHLFFENVGQSDVTTTISIMSFHVAEADTIFRQTDFTGDGQNDHIGFYISKITIFTKDSANYKLSSTSMPVEDYLTKFSQYDFEGECLGIAFTDRDFDKGVVGLAWVASSSYYGGPGGICQRRIPLSNGLYSLNTALVTFRNYGEALPLYKVSLTLTHEIGHSFGSPHDNPSNPMCEGGDFGTFIMNPYTSDGTMPNHFIFSNCSINHMMPVLHRKSTCFRDSKVALCGNRIVEDGEECDCGDSHTCNAIGDVCCTPSDSVYNFNTDAPCRLKRRAGKICSPQTSACCTSNCMYVPRDERRACSAASDCREIVFCNGANAGCPPTINKPDGTRCFHGRKTCVDGICKGNLCTAEGLMACSCTEEDFLCHQCCYSASGTCLPSHKVLAFREETLRVGEPCTFFKGYCDVLGTCVLRDPNSVFKRLSAVFKEQGMDNVRLWLLNYWYYLLMAVGGGVFLLVIFVNSCRKKGDTHLSAYMCGQIIRIRVEGENQIDELEKRKRHFIEHTEHKIQRGLKDDSQSVMMARIRRFFPTVPNTVLRQTMQFSSSELTAVQWLLVRGYPLKKCPSAKD